MFRFCITLATLLAMLLHAGIGCCWHHAHPDHAVCMEQASGRETVSDTQASACCHHKCHRHSHAGTEGIDGSEGPSPKPDRHQPAHEDCSDETCQYLLADILKAPAPAEGSSVLDAPAALSSQVALRMVGLHGDRWRADATLSHAKRPHARELTQVWLL